MKTSLFRICISTGLILALQGCTQTESDHSQTDRSASDINEIADRYYDFTLESTPELSYDAGVEIDRHDGMRDNSPAGLLKIQQVEDELLSQLRAIDLRDQIGSAGWITHAYLLEQIQSSVATRVCRTELWNVNQMGGWQSGYARLAQLQPVGTPELRAQSLSRWSKFPHFVDQEIANLETGLKEGYSAPRTVVVRVIDQVNRLLALDPEESPFYSPAIRDGDDAFTVATLNLVADRIFPALRRYSEFLSDTYMDSAREALSVTANPDGASCYEASLRMYTTLDRSGKEVFELGSRTVDANKASVIEMGKSAYGLDDFESILTTIKNDPTDKFATRDELLDFSRMVVLRAAAKMKDRVGAVPGQKVEVIPFEAFEEGTGRSAHYNPGNADRPGEYRIPLYEPENQSRGSAEITAFHETWPGHHLQSAVAQSIEGLHPATRLIWFSGPGEGWARYSEGLAEEMGLYETTTGPILRRAWPARGMVVDPGLHLFGWTREKARAFMVESGRFTASDADEMVDRIAILPGQLTAYDSGGLAIMALRTRAQAELGDTFDIREFHDRILENGTIPIEALRERIEMWIRDSRSGAISSEAISSKAISSEAISSNK